LIFVHHSRLGGALFACRLQHRETTTCCRSATLAQQCAQGPHIGLSQLDGLGRVMPEAHYPRGKGVFNSVTLEKLETMFESESLVATGLKLFGAPLLFYLFR
jgi:hypothetical protein